MNSQINPDLLPLTTGPNKGKISTSNLRQQLEHARDESTAHGTAIESLGQNLIDTNEQLEAFTQQTNEALSQANEAISHKLDETAADDFATAAQGLKADQAILYDQESGKAILPNGELVTIGGAAPPTILMVGNGSVTFED